MGLGELPAEYSKAVHGPYDPAIFYGKKDTPFGQVGQKYRSRLESLVYPVPQLLLARFNSSSVFR